MWWVAEKTGERNENESKVLGFLGGNKSIYSVRNVGRNGNCYKIDEFFVLTHSIQWFCFFRL